MADKKNPVININIRNPTASPNNRGSGGRKIPNTLIFQNPIPIFATILILLVLAGVFFGLAIDVILGLLKNLWMWVACILVATFIKPDSKSTIGFALIIGVIIWGIGVYQEYSEWSAVFDVPFLGFFAQIVWGVSNILPSIFKLVLSILVPFVVIYTLEFVKYQASN